MTAVKCDRQYLEIDGSPASQVADLGRIDLSLSLCWAPFNVSAAA